MWQRYPVLIVLRLLRDWHRQGTGNPMVGIPSSPCHEKRGDNVMSSGPMGETAGHLLPWICVKPYNRASGSRRWPSGQTKGEALSSPFLGILFLQGSMDLPSTNRKQKPGPDQNKTKQKPPGGPLPSLGIQVSTQAQERSCESPNRLVLERGPVGPTYLLLP